MANNIDPDSSWAPSANDEAVIALLNTSANVAATNCLQAPQGLNYVVHAYIVCTAAGAGDTVPTFTIGYTDDSGANTANLNAPASPALGAHASTVLDIYCISGSWINYAISGGSYANGSQYSVRLVIKIV